MVTLGTIERNKTCVRKLIEEVINVGRLDLCDCYLAADRVDFQDYGLLPGAANGHEGFKRVLGGFLEAFPDLHLRIEFMIGEGDRLMGYISTTGTHTGRFMGMAPTGKKFQVNGTDIFHFNEEGKVAAHWGIFRAIPEGNGAAAPTRQASSMPIQGARSIMKDATQRSIIRCIHIVCSIPIVGYIYSPFDVLPDYASATRFVFLPVMFLSGLWMWKGHVLRRLFRNDQPSPVRRVA